MSGGVTSGSLGTGPQAGSRGGQQVVMFRIGTESFALDAGMVRAVTEIDPASCQAVPPVGTTWRPEYIRSIVKARDEFIIVPELEQILN